MSKQSAVECSLQLQIAELVVGPFHLALVFFICVVHVFLSLMSLGNWKRLTPSLFVLEQPQTMQYLPIVVSYNSWTLPTSHGCFIKPMHGALDYPEVNMRNFKNHFHESDNFWLELVAMKTDLSRKTVLR